MTKLEQTEKDLSLYIRRAFMLPDNTDVKIQSRTLPEGDREILIKIKGSRRGDLTLAREKAPVSAEANDDRAFFLAALKDAKAKNKFSFISLQWFKRTYLPALGANYTQDELSHIITSLIAQGDIVVEQVDNPFKSGFPVTAIRLADDQA